MPRRESTPVTRAADAKRHVSSVKRKYAVDVTKRKKLLPAEIPHVEDTVVVLKVAGYSRSQMAKVIGISRGQVKEILEKPDVTEKIVRIRAALPQAALDLLQGYMIEAVQVLVDVMRVTEDHKLRIQAASEILDRGGLPKSSRQERTNINDNRTTFTDEGILEKLRSAPVHVQEQAAQMIEDFEKLLSEHSQANEIEGFVTEEADETV